MSERERRPGRSAAKAMPTNEASEGRLTVATTRHAEGSAVSLDHLVGEGLHYGLDKKTLKRLQELEQLDDDKKKTLYDLIDTYIRDAKARKTYA